MRIGLFTDTYLPDVNGVVSSIETLRKALVNEGHEVFVVCPKAALEASSLEGNVLHIPGLKLKFLYDYTLATPWNPKAFKIVEKLKLDVIHVHTEFGIGIFAREVSKKLGIPIVATYHTFYEDYTHYVNIFNSEHIDKWAKKAVRNLSKYFAESVESVIVPTQKTKDRLTDYGVTTQMDIVPTGLDLDSFKSLSEELVRPFEAECFMLIYVGRLAEEKSVDIVIKAMTHLKEENVGLFIVGDGPDYNKLKALVKTLNLDDKVRFAGKIPHSNIAAYYQQADCFVSASLSETQGMTFIEAMATGLPVLACDRVALQNVLIDGINGYYFNDEEDLAEKIMQLKNNEKLEEMKVISEKIADEYSLSSFALKAEKVYLKAIEDFNE